MSLRARTEAALQGLGKALGTPLALDDQGVAVIDFAGDLTGWLAVSEAVGLVTLRVPLLQQFNDVRDRTAQAALRLNLREMGPVSGRIGMIPSEGAFVYRADLRDEITAEALAAFLDRAMSAAVLARDRLLVAVQADSSARDAGDGLRDEAQILRP